MSRDVGSLPDMTRIGSPSAALLCVALLATGCSGSSSSKAKEVTPTKATGTTAAGAINLKAADLPTTWKSEPADNSNNAPDATDKKLATCLGLPTTDTNDVVDLNSDGFSTGQPPAITQVNSEVEVVATLAQAKRLAKAFSGDKSESCFKTMILEEAKTQGGDDPSIKYGTPTVTKQTVPSGVDNGFAFDFTVPISAQGISVKANFSIVGFYVKHTGVTLQTTTLGTPASDYDQTKLLSTLVTRAKASAV